MYVRSYFDSLYRITLVAFVLGFFVSAAGARDLNRYSDIEWRTTGKSATSVPAAGAGPSGYGMSAGGPHAFGKKPLPWPGKSQAENMAKWKAMASPAAMAKKIINPAGFIPLLAGMGIKAMMDLACVRLAGGKMQLAPGAQWEECNFVNGGIVTEYRPGFGTWVGGWTSSFGSACQAGTDHVASLQPSGNSWVADTSAPGQCWAVRNGNTAYPIIMSTRQGTASSQDGYKVASPDVAEAKVASQLQTRCDSDYVANADGDCIKVLRELIEAGQSVPATDEALTGPASLSVPPVVETSQSSKTNPDGSTTSVTVTSTTNTTYQYTYSGDVVTVTIVNNNVKSTATPVGTTTEQSSTQSEPDTKLDPCTEHPGRAGCADLGTPPDSEALPHEDHPISITPVVFAGGGCPGPVAVVVFGRSYAIEYTPLCAALASIAPLMLALSGLAAAWIFVSGLKV